MVTPLVVASVSDDEWRTHVRSALEPWMALRIVPTIRALMTDSGTQPPELVLWHLNTIADIDDACVAALEVVRRRWTHASVVAYCQVGVATAPLLVAAGRAGIDRLLLRGHDNLRDAVRNEVRSRGIGTASRDVLMRLNLPPSAGTKVVAHCLQRVTSATLTVDQLAADLGVHRKTVRNWLRAAGLPSPERVIGWSRLLVAASLLQTPGRTAASVSAWLSFASESALRGMLTRYAGMTPNELRQPHGFSRLIAAFHASRYVIAIEIPR